MNKGVVDSGYGGVLMEKSSEEAMELFETLSEHTQQFSSRGRQGVKSKGMYEVNLNGGSPNQMAAVERKLDIIIMGPYKKPHLINKLHHSMYVLYVLILIILLRLALCIHLQIKSKQTM